MANVKLCVLQVGLAMMLNALPLTYSLPLRRRDSYQFHDASMPSNGVSKDTRQTFLATASPTIPIESSMEEDIQEDANTNFIPATKTELDAELKRAEDETAKLEKQRRHLKKFDMALAHQLQLQIHHEGLSRRQALHCEERSTTPAINNRRNPTNIRTKEKEWYEAIQWGNDTGGRMAFGENIDMTRNDSHHLDRKLPWRHHVGKRVALLDIDKEMARIDAEIEARGKMGVLRPINAKAVKDEMREELSHYKIPLSTDHDTVYDGPGLEQYVPIQHLEEGRSQMNGLMDIDEAMHAVDASIGEQSLDPGMSDVYRELLVERGRINYVLARLSNSQSADAEIQQEIANKTAQLNNIDEQIEHMKLEHRRELVAKKEEAVKEAESRLHKKAKERLSKVQARITELNNAIAMKNEIKEIENNLADKMDAEIEREQKLKEDNETKEYEKALLESKLEREQTLKQRIKALQEMEANFNMTMKEKALEIEKENDETKARQRQAFAKHLNQTEGMDDETDNEDAVDLMEEDAAFKKLVKETHTNQEQLDDYMQKSDTDVLYI